MVKAETKGIEVAVECKYVSEHSEPNLGNYFFAYEITIQNNSSDTVQLRRRHWFIFDSCGDHREVEGEGVVGENPVIAPGEHFTYTSGCNLHSDIGSMKGTYLIENTKSHKTFLITIPEFYLIVPGKLN